MTKETDFSFKQDKRRDTLSHCFSGLSIDVLETAFEQDGELAVKYAEILAEKKQGEVLYHISPVPESEISVSALKEKNVFSVSFVSKTFQAQVDVVYDPEIMDASEVSVAFSGNDAEALAWGRAVKILLDDMLLEHMQNGEE